MQQSGEIESVYQTHVQNLRGLGFVLGARDIELIPGGCSQKNHREVGCGGGKQDTWEQARSA